MKKKILCAIGVAAFAVAVAVNINASMSNGTEMDVTLANVEALARNEINPECPNGCVGGSGGCYCRDYYPYYKEYSGWN